MDAPGPGPAAWPFGDLVPGRYATLLVDPPWAYRTFSPKGLGRSAEGHYRVMSPAEMLTLPVGALAAKHAFLFLWVTGPCFVQGMHLPLMEAWGFKPSSDVFVWLKAKPRDYANGCFFLTEAVFRKGMGHTSRKNAEYVILGRRGSPRRLSKSIHQIIVEPAREHSRKPEQVFERIESYCAGPRVELFARQRRPGWDSWGNQVDLFAEGAP